MSRRTQIVLGLTLAALFVWLFLRQAELGEVVEALRETRLGYLSLAVGLVLVNQLQRAWRWKLLLRPLAPIRTGPALSCTLMGWAVTVLLPGRLGEIVRPVLLSRRTAVSASAAIGSVVLERVFDALAVLLILAFYLAFLPPPSGLDDRGRLVLDAMRTTGLLSLVALLGLGVVTILALRNRRLRERIQSLLSTRLPGRVGALARSFLTGMAGLRSPWLVVRISISSLLLWGCILVIYITCFRAMGIELPWYASIPVLVLLVLGVMVPTPAGVGSFHKAAQFGLVSLWAVDNEVAVAYAIVSHAVAFLPLALIGSALLFREGLDLGSVSRMRAPGGENGSRTGV